MAVHFGVCRSLPPEPQKRSLSLFLSWELNTKSFCLMEVKKKRRHKKAQEIFSAAYLGMLALILLIYYNFEMYIKKKKKLKQTFTNGEVV